MLVPGNTEPGPLVETGIPASFRCSMIIDIVSKSEDLPTFEALMEDPRVLHASSQVILPDTTMRHLFEGIGYRGWCIPGLMVIKGDEGALVATASDGEALTPTPDDLVSCRIFHADRVEAFYGDATPNTVLPWDIRDGLPEAVAGIGGRDFNVSTTIRWLAMSDIAMSDSVVSGSGEFILMFDELTIHRWVAEADTLPTFRQLARRRTVNPLLPPISPPILNPYSIDLDDVKTPVTFEGSGFQGWWVPDLMVLKGVSGVVLMTCCRIPDSDPAGSDADEGPTRFFRITNPDETFSANMVESVEGREGIIEALKAALEFAGGDPDELPNRTVEAWFEASGGASDSE